MGRVSEYNEEFANKICDLIAKGESLSAICRRDDMPVISTVFKWLNDFEEFSDRYARAKQEQSELFADEIVHIADTEIDPQRARVRIDARKWVAAKLKPKKYGERIHNEISGEITTNNKNMSDAELNRRAAELLNKAGEVRIDSLVGGKKKKESKK